MRPLVIDSNILIYHLQNDRNVTETLTQWFLQGERLFICAVTRTEVLASPILKEQTDEEKRIIQLLEQFFLIPIDARVADAAARIRRIYRLKLGDSFIAATALLLDATLVTRNVRDFKRIPDLTIQSL